MKDHISILVDKTLISESSESLVDQNIGNSVAPPENLIFPRGINKAYLQFTYIM